MRSFLITVAVLVTTLLGLLAISNYQDQKRRSVSVQIIESKEILLKDKITSLQSKIDSIEDVSKTWIIEKDLLEDLLSKRDVSWTKKSKKYAVKKDSIVHNSTNSELADFLSRH